MGERVELEAWVREGYAAAYRTACLLVRDRADAEEAVQEAYLRAWRFRDSLPSGEGGRPWLYRVLVNACWSKLRSEAPRRDRSAGPAGLSGLTVDDGTDELDAARLVREALLDLPPALRAPVVLRYWTGLSEREIATAIRRRPGTVKSRLHEARRRLAVDPRLAEAAGGAR